MLKVVDFKKLKKSKTFNDKILDFSADIGFEDLIYFLNHPEFNMKQCFLIRDSPVDDKSRYRRMLRLANKLGFSKLNELRNTIIKEIYIN